MKKISKFLIGAVAFASIFAFTSCGAKGGASGMIKGANNNYSIDEANTEDTQSRGFVSSKTKHNYASCLIEVESSQTQTSRSKAGTMGFMFGLEKNEDNTYNFCLVAVAKRTDNKNIWDPYVSVYRNIDSATMETAQNFGVAPAKSYTSTSSDFLTDTDPCELQLLVFNETHPITVKTDYTGAENGAGKIKFVVEQNITLTAAQNNGTAHTGTGDYTVTFYTDDDTAITTGANNTITISANLAGIKESEIGDNAKMQRLVGFYANVYDKSSIKGSWKMSDVKGESDVIEIIY